MGPQFHPQQFEVVQKQGRFYHQLGTYQPNLSQQRTYQFVLYDELPSLGFWEIFSKPSKKPEDLIRSNLENRYVDFIIEIISDYKDDNQLSNTVGGTFSKYFGLDFAKAIYSSIAVDKELARRVELFNQLADASQQVDVDSGDTLSDEEIKKIQTNSAKAFAEFSRVISQYEKLHILQTMCSNAEHSPTISKI